MVAGWYHRAPLLQSAPSMAGYLMSKRRRTVSIASPRVWGTWMLVALGWCLARLPLGIAIRTGTLLGRFAYSIARSRRHITEVNLALCFPELSPAMRDRLAKSAFVHAGAGIAELMIAWLNPRKPVRQRFTMKGIEHLHEAASHGRGVLLLGAHFSCMDFISQPLSEEFPIDVLYRRNRNPVWEWLQVRGRRHYFDGVIEREDMRQTLRRLRAGRAVWYAPDQDYGRRHSVFVPFFGVPAATVTATARLARFNGSPVLFMCQHRNLDALTWHIEIAPALEGFPTGNDDADAARINAVVEEAVREHPEQYLWMHRRFKTRPEGESKPY
jgi:Kdo2-lipid IVA lauroyltransferase/acyltransferase